MVKKLVVGCVVFAATSLFGMSLDELNKASKRERKVSLNHLKIFRE